jgi:hypothetical protein
MWMPGMSPVNVPVRIPRRSGIRSCIINNIVNDVFYGFTRLSLSMMICF